MTDSVPVANLKPAPWNPRLIKDKRFQQLCRSLAADPDFMEQRPILATADGTVYAGNMRLRAAIHLGWPTVPAILEDIPEQLAKERALRDNNGFGEWQEDQLSELLTELQMAGSDLDVLGFEPDWLNALIGEPDFQPVGEDEQGRLDQKAPVTCPNCGEVFSPS